MNATSQPWVRKEGIAGDASTRSYSRLWDRNGRSAVAVQYPPADQHLLQRDLEVRTWCEAHSIRVPALLEYDIRSGWAVMEDLGSRDAESFLATIPAPDRLSVALRAVDPLVSFGNIALDSLPSWNSALGRERLRWELAGFELWFLRHLRRVHPKKNIGAWLDDLATTIDLHPKRVCHRDYHLNNLFILSSGEVGVIDFQDILIGPDTYDAVSLMGDRGMSTLLDCDQRELWQEAWARDTTAQPDWKERWRWTQSQRGLKVLGTFARLIASGKPAYIPWLKTMSRDLAPRIEDLGAPQKLVSLLLDCDGVDLD